MTAEERRQRIEEHLKAVEFASLDELSDKLDVSTSTIRRDVTHLEGRRVLKRTHGGARLVSPQTDEFVFSTRETRETDAKSAIGRACADLLEPNRTVIMDAGSTVYHVARHLAAKAPHLITNSLPVANLFASRNEMEVILSGGVIYPRLGVLVGPMAVESFSRMRADVAIMGAGGLTEEGVSNSHMLLIDIQLAMMRAARTVIFCLDHTKFGRPSLARLCDFEGVRTIVTDAGVSPEWSALLEAKGVRLVVGQGHPV